MIKMTLAQAAQLLALPEAAPHVGFTGLSIDTRTLKPGNLFIALPGTQVDGHEFVEEARLHGAIGALVKRKTNSILPQLQVDDPVLALGTLASAWRDRFDIPIIAATGSNGKTTLKNMLAAILTAACEGDATRVLATPGTLNNHLGLPLTLAQLNDKHRYATIEMGMNHFGEIKYLTKMTRPTVAVITNAAAAHLDGVGNIAGVAKAKSEIFLGMTEKGIAILNRDDPFYTYWLEQINHRRHLSFGFHTEANINSDPDENMINKKVIINTPKGQLAVNLPLLGKHNVLNALAATAATLALGIELEAIQLGLETTVPAPGRLQVHTLPNGVKIIDDTYNANPYSLKAALEALTAFNGKKILVLGDMKELGQEAQLIHQNVGREIRGAGIDYLFTFGELSAQTASSFGEGAYHFNEQAKLINALKPFLYNQTIILVKGSRSMHMEKIVAGLVAD